MSLMLINPRKRRTARKGRSAAQPVACWPHVMANAPAIPHRAAANAVHRPVVVTTPLDLPA